MAKKLFEPGQSGNPTGRPKGSLNKFSKLKLYSITETLNEMECNPFQILAELAMTAKSDYVKVQAASELCQYIEPKLKSIEHKGDQQSPVKFNIVLGQ